MSDSFKKFLLPVPQFYDEVKKDFAFLQSQYKYIWHDEKVDAPDDYRDTTVYTKYLGTKIGVEIYWYISTGIIDVAFVELQYPGLFPEKSMFFESAFWREKKEVSRGIKLSTLVAMLGHKEDPSFLLSDYDNVMESKCKKRIDIIQTNISGVIEGLAIATQSYGAGILAGDTTLFPEVIRYYTKIRNS